jgi:hypothetical protein
VIRYRKRPVVVDAIRNGGQWQPIIDWLQAIRGPGLLVPLGGRPPFTRNEDGTLDVVTLEGTMRCEVGDWLICGTAGEFYPVKPGIFNVTYEAVD